MTKEYKYQKKVKFKCFKCFKIFEKDIQFSDNCKCPNCLTMLNYTNHI